ncbi:MAG TPA: GNAT family N-acetyltransferase [Acidimicrobiales bacterium]|nr:GNAT family N-acetyltransferase [Acidimicrobiales bacterium]
MALSMACDCGTTIEGPDLDLLQDAFLVHVRAEHTDWPYPDVAVKNYAAATQRLAPVEPRRESIGDVEVHRVDESRLDDWGAFFDRDAFAGKPEWAACYCSEPHCFPKGGNPSDEVMRPWQESRRITLDLLRDGRSFGYLAYVDGRPAAWVNASLRSEYALYREGEGADPGDGDVIGVSCFIVAPPYRRHGLADRLLERVIADAPARGAAWIEAYPFVAEHDDDAGNFRGPRPMWDARGFVEVARTDRHAIVRRPVSER